MTVYAITDTKKGEQGLRLLIFKLPLSLPGANGLGSEKSSSRTLRPRVSRGHRALANDRPRISGT